MKYIKPIGEPGRREERRQCLVYTESAMRKDHSPSQPTKDGCAVPFGKKTQIAKLSRPQLGDVYHRSHIFSLLDEARDANIRIIWLSAPGGAGKTTLINDYLQLQNGAVFWYRLDEGDADVASFFHCLGQLFPEDTDKLPPLTSEYMAGLPTYTRNFFRNLATLLPHNSTLVFDNYQDVPETAPLHELLQLGLSELPNSIRIFMLSRTNPPAIYSRQQAYGALQVINWDTLGLSLNETREFCTDFRQQDLTPQQIKCLHKKTGGWITGLLLMLEHLPSIEKEEINDALLFEFFASEVFTRSPPELQAFLVKTSFLPELTVQAATRITGNEKTAAIFEDLHRRNLFTSRLSDSPATYNYHPLFREFLLSKANALFDATEQKRLRHEAALAYQEEAKPELAIQLYLDNGDSEEALPLIGSIAEQVLQQGRNATLSAWLARVPADILQKDPWAVFWQGKAIFSLTPPQAITCFEQAFHLFAEQNDINGMYWSIGSACLSIHLTQHEQRRQDAWIQRFVALDKLHPFLAHSKRKAEVLGDVLLACYWREPTNEHILAYLDKAYQLWQEEKDITARILLGLGITFFDLGMGNYRRGKQIMQAHDLLIEQHRPSAFTVIWHKMYAGFFQAIGGNPVEGARHAEYAYQCGRQSGIHILDCLVLGAWIHNLLLLGDMEATEENLQRLSDILTTTPQNLDTAHYHLLRCWQQLWQGDSHTALTNAQIAVGLAEEVGAPHPISLCRTGLAHALTAEGRYAEARKALEKSRLPYAYGEYRPHQYENRLLTTFLDLRDGKRDAAKQQLKDALQIAREDDYGLPLLAWPEFICTVFDFALENGIETALVQRIIKQCPALQQYADTNLANWPWPVKIYTLSRFSLLIDGEPYSLTGKAQQRPAELLKLLITSGGRNISQERLIEDLWPDASSETATQTFHTTLHRLRKLLKHSKAITLKDGQLTLDTHYVWIDVWAFERLLGQLETALATIHADPVTISRLSQQALELYKGPFLGQERERPWSLIFQERLNQRLSRLFLRLGQFWEQHQADEQAISCYQQALQIDPLSEVFYQGLMQTYTRQGRMGEALSTYEHCRNVLAKRLHISPSEKTVAIYKKILGNHKSGATH